MSEENLGSLFVTPDGGITPATFLVLLGGPIAMSGYVIPGLVIILLGIASALRQILKDLRAVDKHGIRYESLKPNDIMAELEVIEESSSRGQEAQAQCFAGLEALATKWNSKGGSTDDIAEKCQDAAYIALRMFPEHDELVAGAISLLALVAKNPKVRERYKVQPQVYSIPKAIQVLRKALIRAKKEETEQREEILAEIHRKGSLFLGALSDGDDEKELPIKVVEADGLELILDGANWFRLHEDVANWALWATFTICYDNVRNKFQLVRLSGIPTVCELMKNNPKSLEVNRHGVAILFDLLREGNEKHEVEWNPWEVRRVALAAGLHDVVLKAMNEFSDSMDVIMMGQQILLGTGFKDDIPQYQEM